MIMRSGVEFSFTAEYAGLLLAAPPQPHFKAYLSLERCLSLQRKLPFSSAAKAPIK